MSILYSIFTLELVYSIMILNKINDILTLVKRKYAFCSYFWNILDQISSDITHFKSLR